MSKSCLKQAGEIVTLIGAILETIFHSVLILSTFGCWIIPAIIFIPLTWINRVKSVKNESKGWIIYGIVQSAIFNRVGLIGYILLLIDKFNLDNEIQSEEQ